MKRLFGWLLAALIIYAIYLDLTAGTLPAFISEQVEQPETASENPQAGLPSFSAKVTPGDTVISIVEHQLNKQLPVSITDLIEDFQQLNPGQTPEKIQIGATYAFPDYSKNED